MQRNAIHYQSLTNKHPLFSHVTVEEGQDLQRRAINKLKLFASMALILSLAVYFY